MANPTISILITTYNRKEKLLRAIESVLKQTFTDFEIIIIDDASTDGTEHVIPKDPRIKYHKNVINVGSKYGDRLHIKDFLTRLAVGEYFLYLCSDDQLIPHDLLNRQMLMHEAYPHLAMVIGGQVSDFGDNNHVFHEGVFPDTFMTSKEFLNHFCKHPIESNIIIGATLYNTEIFRRSGVLQGEGSKWQAGYEMLMGPAQYGDVVYINGPCILTEIRPENASFQGTQVSQYHDCIASVKAAKLPLDIERETIYNISQAFLRNAEHIKQYGSLTMCSAHNISQPVTEGDIVII